MGRDWSLFIRCNDGLFFSFRVKLLRLFYFNFLLLQCLSSSSSSASPNCNCSQRNVHASSSFELTQTLRSQNIPPQTQTVACSAPRFLSVEVMFSWQILRWVSLKKFKCFVHIIYKTLISFFMGLGFDWI
jgi:hypothetical protein